jgi:hypothetical protein
LVALLYWEPKAISDDLSVDLHRPNPNDVEDYYWVHSANADAILPIQYLRALPVGVLVGQYGVSIGIWSLTIVHYIVGIGSMKVYT